MKKPFARPESKFFILALIIFGFFLVKSLLTVFSPYRFVYQENSAALSAEPQREALVFPDAGPMVDQLKARNFFIGAPAAAKAAAAAAPEALPPPLGPNEIRDDETGATFKYLGTIILGEEPFAFFARIGPAPKGEGRFLFRPKGKPLSKSLRVEEVGAKSVKINQGGKKTELNVFYVDIKRLETDKKAAQK